ncbi:MAG: ferrochelatase [Pirellulaceae bacterium]|nr:ferrochelatase [Pirellulaceae bacterium]
MAHKNGKTLSYDAVVVLSFGGPEGPEDVLPFLHNVTRGRKVPESRLIEVAEHYQAFGGISPINGQNREFVRHLSAELERRGFDLPVMFGNRNWNPYLEDTLATAVENGYSRILVLVTSAFSSYSGCRQYIEDIEGAIASIDSERTLAVDKIRPFYNSVGFIEALQDNLRVTLGELHDGEEKDVQILFTAHSIPFTMAVNCEYEEQLKEACGLVMDQFEHPWKLVFQSRSGPPTQPWLEPDICDAIQGSDHMNIVACPIGFVSDHMEVLFDLDRDAKTACETRGIKFGRVAAVGTNPRFVSGMTDLIEQRCGTMQQVVTLGSHGEWADRCNVGCCLGPDSEN